MKDFPGTPGTLTGFVLRISQCIFAIGSIASMANTASFFKYTAFWFPIPFVLLFYLTIVAVSFTLVSYRDYLKESSYLVASMCLQVTWSLVLALLDAYALVKKKVLHNTALVSLFVVGDWITATLSLGAASASAGILVLYFSDLGNCSFEQACLKYQISVTLAFLSWISILISSLIMLWLLAAA